MKTATVTSSGGVIFRVNGATIEVALIARDDHRVWALPKGLVEQGESFDKAALREVSEETGLTGELVAKIGRIDYWFYWKPEATRYHKFVHFFLIRHTGGDESKHDFEVEEVRWFLIDDAIKALTYKSEKEIMRKAKVMIAERVAR